MEPFDRLLDKIIVIFKLLFVNITIFIRHSFVALLILTGCIIGYRLLAPCVLRNILSVVMFICGLPLTLNLFSLIRDNIKIWRNL